MLFCELFLNYALFMHFYAEYFGGNAKSAARAYASNATIPEFSRTLTV